jgi:hypothetical protein
VWWLTPEIPATLETEIRRIMVQDQKVRETPISTKEARHSGLRLSFQICREAIDRRIVV